MEDELSVKIDLILLLRHLMIWGSILLLDLLEVVGMPDRGFVHIVHLSMKGLGRIVIFVDFHLVGNLRKGGWEKVIAEEQQSDPSLVKRENVDQSVKHISRVEYNR
jgi:hypothetical protein